MLSWDTACRSFGGQSLPLARDGAGAAAASGLPDGGGCGSRLWDWPTGPRLSGPGTRGALGRDHRTSEHTPPQALGEASLQHAHCPSPAPWPLGVGPGALPGLFSGLPCPLSRHTVLPGITRNWETKFHPSLHLSTHLLGPGSRGEEPPLSSRAQRYQSPTSPYRPPEAGAAWAISVSSQVDRTGSSSEATCVQARAEVSTWRRSPWLGWLRTNSEFLTNPSCPTSSPRVQGSGWH